MTQSLLDYLRYRAETTSLAADDAWRTARSHGRGMQCADDTADGLRSG